MPSPRSQEQLAEAARLYYVDDLPQDEVARRLGTSRSNVSRILQAARETGIVKFQIQYPIARRQPLERALVETFGVREALVLDAGSGTSIQDRVGQLAARWLLDHLVEGTTIAVSWGASLQSLTEQVVTDRAYDIDVVQLGGDLQVDPHLSSHEHVRELAARIGGDYSYLHAPAFVKTTFCATSLRDSYDIGHELKKAAAADLALVGIGAFGAGFSQRLLASGVLEPEDRDELIASDPAGDVCARFVDDDGVELDTPLRHRVLAIDLDDLRRIPVVVGVLNGRHKGRALRAVLRGGLLDVVVTDQAAATAAIHLEQAARHDAERDGVAAMAPAGW